MTPVAASASLPVSAAPPAADPGGFRQTDLDRLRELIQSTAAQTLPPTAAAAPVPPPAATGSGQPVRSLGDSILDGVLSFSRSYQSSMQSIETRLQEVVRSESAGLTNLSDLVALQIDVSKWSMSVMGVDNASKAGSNTIKELSRGG